MLIARRLMDMRLIGTAVSVYGTAVATAVLGALFWASTTRLVDASTVGLAGGVISGMVLMARVGTMGLGTLVILRLSEGRPDGRLFARSAVATSGGLGAVLGLAAGVWFLPTQQPGPAVVAIGLLGIGAAAMSAGFVLDAVFIGQQHNGRQLVRNLVASVAKLLLLPLLIVGVGVGDLVGVLGSTALGSVASLIVAIRPRAPEAEMGPRLRRISRTEAMVAVRHHAFNLALLASSLLLPILAAGLPGDASGHFFIAFTIAGLVWAIPESLSMALYATGARDRSLLATRMRTTTVLSLAAGAAASVAMLVLAEPLLGLFGADYAMGGATALQVLTLGVLPELVLSLYVPVTRLDGRFAAGTRLVLAGSLLGLAAAAVGGTLLGPTGMAIGWVAGATLGRLPLLPAIRAAVRSEAYG